jgi:G:T-mismatch repair DNA endonuclease (very short patch repair protein)
MVLSIRYHVMGVTRMIETHEEFWSGKVNRNFHVDRRIIQRWIRRYGNVDWFHVAKKKGPCEHDNYTLRSVTQVMS